MKILFILVITLLGQCELRGAAAKTNDLSLWTRGAGDYRNGKQPARQRQQTLSLKKLSLTRHKHYDPQYDRYLTYRGIALDKLAKMYTGSGKGLQVNLHFRNGMIVPLSKGLNSIFLAVHIKKGKGWSRHFPKVTKVHYRYRDPRPIVFSGNKVVAPTKKHPKLKRTSKDSFSPWLHTDSLVGLEFVNGPAYERQFYVAKDPSTEAGVQVYLSRCQYCHGVNSVGASYGWDFIEPLTVTEKRDISSIYYMVKYKRADAVERGLMMPHQPGFRKQDAAALWVWLQQIQKYRPQTYKP